ncbi:hypothetical protein P4S70_17455 [Enterovibrio sp. Hal110]
MKRSGSLNVGLLIGTTMLSCAGLNPVWANTVTENANGQSDASLVSQAQTCAAIPTRLERLACFDGVFNTPLMLTTNRPLRTLNQKLINALMQVKRRAVKMNKALLCVIAILRISAKASG